MKSKVFTLVMLIVLVTSMLTVTFNIAPSMAKERFTEIVDESQTIGNAQRNTDSLDLDSETLLSGDGLTTPSTYGNNLSGQDSQPSSFDKDKWDFNKTNEWAELANVDVNSVELVIGVNVAKPNYYVELANLINQFGGELANTVWMGGMIRAVVADIPLQASSSFVAEVKAANLLRYAEPNLKFQADFVPNDPYWSSQWGPAKIQADFAWNTTVGNSSVLVAVVDTGIDWDHPDLAANYVPLGYDWVNNDTDPMDDHGHGTHVAGIIAAVINNSIGIAGVAQVRIMAEKGLDSWGWGYEDDLANAIVHAADQGADIISNSWGGYGESELIYEAVKYAYDEGALVIASAGNGATNLKPFPAGYDEVIAVTATDQNDDPAWFTNYGDWVELAAPGVSIYSTVWNDLYTDMSGTSMSAPHVSGVAALIWSQFPNMTRDHVRVQLRYTADDLGAPGFDDFYGYGRVNARTAVEQPLPTHDLLVMSWEKPLYVEPGDTGTVTTAVFNFGKSDESNITVHLLANGSIVDSGTISFLASGSLEIVNTSWSPSIEGIYNVTSYVLPVPNETVIENNLVWASIFVGFPRIAVVLDSAGTDIDVSTWQTLNTNWMFFGDTMIYIDYETLNKDDITYEDIASTDAEVLIISCAFDWEFTDSEIAAIERYVLEGHGLIATAGTLYYQVPNNNKLAPLFGINETVDWSVTGTDLLHLLDPSHPLFVDVPNPYTMADVATAISFDQRWDSNELAGGEYVALGHFEESAIVVHRGLVYISPWLEIIPPYYHFNLQLLYNAIVWSQYRRPEHELVVSIEAPTHLEPGNYTLLNATVRNLGLNNETDVEFQLLIDGIVIANISIPEFPVDYSYALNYTWAPTMEALYNVTAYAPPVLNESYTENNLATKIVYVGPIRYVLFDQTHGADAISFYSIWVSSLTARGYVVDVLTISPVTPSALDGYDVFVIPQAHDSYFIDELSAIQDFVLNGSGLLVIGDDQPYIYTDLTSFAGIDWTYGGVRGITYDITPHEVTEGVASVYLDAPMSEILVATPALDLVRDPAGGIMLAVSEQVGRVIGFADEGSLWDYGIGYEDNLRLANNMIDWLLGVKYEHELAVTLEAPAFVEPGDSSLLNATVHNRGLSNESDVELFLLVNGTIVDNATIPELVTGFSYTLSYHWAPTMEGIYNLTAYAPSVPDENVTANNIVSKMVYVRYVDVALISDRSELLAVTLILDSMGVGYDIYNDNSMYLYTEDLSLLLDYPAVIFYTDYRHITSAEYSTLQSYLSFGGNLLVTGFDSLISDYLLADLVRSSSYGDNMGEPDLFVVDASHPIMNGPYGSFPAGYHITGLYSDNDAAEADTARMAVTVAELADGYDKIIATYELPGKVVFWNGRGDYDWTWNVNCEVMFKNTLAWFTVQYEHELTVSLDAPAFVEPGGSSLLNATVHNHGLNNETDVELQLLINGTEVNSVVIPELLNGSSYTLSYLWTPAIEALYNVTAYAPPVPDENITINNVNSRYVIVSYAPKIVAYVQYTDYGQEYANALRAIDSTFGPNYLLTELWDYTQLDSMLPGNDILFVPEQEHTRLPTMYMIGTSWSTTLSNFMAEGGIIIVCDYSGGSYGILTGAGLMSISGVNYITGSTVYLVDPSDPLAEGVSNTFVAPNGALSFLTAETNVVFNDGTYPVVIHKTIGLGQIALIGFDYYASNPDADRILGNAVGLVRYEHDIAVSLQVPTVLEPSDSSLLNATVSNHGLSNESDVELFLLVNGTVVDNATIPELLTGSSYTLSYLWTPTVEALYNITAYAPSVAGENILINNLATKIVYVGPIRYVLFDQTHGADAISFYSIWVSSLTARGYVVDVLTISPVTPSALDGYDVFVIPQAHDSYSVDELSAIQGFVAEGGGLLVIGDDNPSVYSDLTEFAGISWMSGGTSGITTDITSHEVTEGVVSVYLSSPIAQMQTSGAALDLVRDHVGGIMLSVSEHMLGKVLGFADENSLWNNRINQKDNLQLADNMIDWLAMPIRDEHELVVTLKVLSHVIPNTTAVVRAIVFNHGANNETEVTLSLIINGSLVQSHTVPELIVGSHYSMSYLWTPAAEGTYNITAYTPPVPDEAVLSNNVATKTVSVFSIVGTYVFVNPTESTVLLNETFTVDIDVVQVTDLYAWQIKLYFDPTILNFTAAWYPPDHVFAGKPFIEMEPFLDRDAYGTYIMFGASLLGSPPGFSGAGTLCQIKFKALTLGLSDLEFSRPIPGGTFLLDPNLDDIPFTVGDGFVEAVPYIPVVHDIAITSVEPATAEVYAGQMVNINVTVVNEGDVEETFNVTLYYNTTAIKTETLTLSSLDFATLNFTWNTTGVLEGNHTIIAVADVVPGETETADNTYIDGTVHVREAVRDVAIISVVPSDTEVYVGEQVEITVAVTNEGEVIETFDVTVYYNVTSGAMIGTQTVMNLLPDANRTLTFHWNTTGVKPRGYYITAVASVLPAETDTTDNAMSSADPVNVKLFGDINGDGKVDIKDIAMVALAFGSYPSHSRWNPKADLNGDNKVDIKDIAIVAKHFGETS